MIKSFLFLIFFCWVSFTYAQNSSDDLKSRFRPGVMWFYTGLRPAQVEKVRKYDRLIFDITYNDWNGDKKPFENIAPSIGFNTNLMFDIPLTRCNTVSLGVGIAHQLVNIRHENKFTIIDSISSTIYQTKESTDLFQKSSLSGNSFSIPLEIRFRGRNWKHVKLHLGGKVGYQLNWYSKEIYQINGRKEKLKRFGFPDEEKWVYSAHLRIGVRNWALFGNYNFNNIFSGKQSTKLNLLQMGVSISLF